MPVLVGLDGSGNLIEKDKKVWFLFLNEHTDDLRNFQTKTSEYQTVIFNRFITGTPFDGWLG